MQLREWYLNEMWKSRCTKHTVSWTYFLLSDWFNTLLHHQLAGCSGNSADTFPLLARAFQNNIPGYRSRRVHIHNEQPLHRLWGSVEDAKERGCNWEEKRTAYWGTALFYSSPYILINPSFGVITRRVVFINRRFGTPCWFHLIYPEDGTKKMFRNVASKQQAG